MSLRSWSTSYEWRRLDADIRTLGNMIISFSANSDSDSDTDDDLSSLSSNSNESSGSSSSTTDFLDSSDESDDELELIDVSIQCILFWAHRVHSKIQNHRIDFGRRLLIADFGDSECISHFRFRKADLQAVANQLWPRLSVFLGPNRDDLTLDNRYHAPFETCFLIYLFKMSRPRCLLEDCEAMFHMRKSHLSSAVLTFARGLFRLSIKYLLNPRTWHG